MGQVLARADWIDDVWQICPICATVQVLWHGYARNYLDGGQGCGVLQGQRGTLVDGCDDGVEEREEEGKNQKEVLLLCEGSPNFFVHAQNYTLCALKFLRLFTFSVLRLGCFISRTARMLLLDVGYLFIRRGGWACPKRSETLPTRFSNY